MYRRAPAVDAFISAPSLHNLKSFGLAVSYTSTHDGTSLHRLLASARVVNPLLGYGVQYESSRMSYPLSIECN